MHRYVSSVLLMALLLTACASPEPSGSSSPGSTATPAAASVLPQANDCANPEAGYRVAFADGWYSNAGVADAQDCTLFAQQPIAAVSDPWIAIVFEVRPTIPDDPFGPMTQTFFGYEVLVDEETSVAGRLAWVREFEITEPGVDEVFGVGDRYTHLFVDLGGDQHLWARTTIAGDDYEAIKAALDQMVESLEFTSP